MVDAQVSLQGTRLRTGQVGLCLLHAPLSVVSNSVTTYPNGEVKNEKLRTSFCPC